MLQQNVKSTQKTKQVKLASQWSQLSSSTGKRKEKIKAQTEVIEWHKKKVENLKATSMHLDPK